MPPAFMKRFPGIVVDHIDGTTDKLIARVLAEQKGGRVIADVISGALSYLPQILEMKLVTPVVMPEAASYPAQLKGDSWVATDVQFYIAGWNTNLVKKGEEPKQYEELANAKWKDNLMGEPRDFQLLIGFARRKFNSDEKASRSVQKNRRQPGRVSQGAFSVGRVSRGRPARRLLYLLRAPFPATGEEGRADSGAADRRRGRNRRLCDGAEGRTASQRRFAVGALGCQRRRTKGLCSGRRNSRSSQSGTFGKNPAGCAAHATLDDIKEFPRYEKIWKEIFQIR